MKRFPVAGSLLLISFLFCSAGCGNHQAKVDATKPLQESFQGASPEVQTRIEAVNASLRAGDYNAAVDTLLPVVNGQQLSEAQRRAAALSLQQINQAIAANPKIDSAELFKKRRQLAQKLYRGG